VLDQSTERAALPRHAYRVIKLFCFDYDFVAAIAPNVRGFVRGFNMFVVFVCGE
jgi:hypothetical protein